MEYDGGRQFLSVAKFGDLNKIGWGLGKVVALKG